MSRELYQQLYDDPTLHYGDAEHHRCPGVRYLPKFKFWLVPPIIDLGCGRGQLVELLRARGLQADGIDFVIVNRNMKVGDITGPLDLRPYQTALALDIFEHLSETDLEGLIGNMQQCYRQVITLSIDSARETGFDLELHINQKTFEQWDQYIEERFEVTGKMMLEEGRRLYICGATDG